MYKEYLCQINKSICNNDFGIRDESFFNLIDKYINYVNNYIEDELILKSSMKVSALIKLYQPFNDGNHRTALIVFGDLITSKGYSFDYQTAFNDMSNKRLNIPTIYSEDDEIGTFNKWFKYISKPEMKL